MAKKRKPVESDETRIPMPDDSEERVYRIPTEDEEEEINQAVDTEAVIPAINQPQQQPEPRIMNPQQQEWERKRQERKQQLSFLKVWARDVGVNLHDLAKTVGIRPITATDWLRIILSVAAKNGGDTDRTHRVVKDLFNTALVLPQEGNLAINDAEISALITLMPEHGQELMRAVSQSQGQGQRQQRQVVQQQQQQPQQVPASHNYHNNTINDNTMSMPEQQVMEQQQDDQFQFPEMPLLRNILVNQGVFQNRIPGILSNYKYMRNAYLGNPSRFFEMLRSQLGQVNAVGVFQNFQDAVGLHHPEVSAQFPGIASSMPANGVFPNATATGNPTAAGGMGQAAGLMGNPQWANQPMNPNMWQYISQGMPPPPTGGSMSDYFIWQKMYETWQEDQKFKREQHRNINNLMGNAGNPQGQDLMSQLIPLITAGRPDLLVTWNYDPNTGKQIPSVQVNPNYQQNNGKADANTEITKAMMGMLSTIASGMIGQQNKPDQATQLLGSILPSMMNKAFNSTDQVQAIQKMIEVSNMLQKPAVTETAEIAQAKIDTKFAMWREELEYRKTVRDWDVQDRREKQAAAQQGQFLDMFKEAGKDAIPTLLKMFSGPMLSMLMPKNASPEQMMAAAQQRMAQQGMQMPPGMVPPGMVPPQHQRQQQQQQPLINPFQGAGPIGPMMPPQEYSPFQGQGPPPVQQPQMYSPPPYNQAPPPQEEIPERPPSPEEFMQMHPQDIDSLYDKIQTKQQYLEQFENNMRIGRARQKMMSQPPIQSQPQYNPANMPQGQGGGQPGYGEGFVSNRGVGQQTDEDYVDESQFQYEMMPANTMTEAEESTKGGQVMSTNDLRNEIADYNQNQGIPDQGQGYEPQGYDAINTQGMEDYQTPQKPQPGQSQSATAGFDNEEPTPSAASIPEINEPLEPIEGTQIADNRPSQQQQPSVQQGNERVIRRPSRQN